MASGSVIVHDIESLESYMGVLQSKRDDLEGLYGVLSAETSNQGGNWLCASEHVFLIHTASFCILPAVIVLLM